MNITDSQAKHVNKVVYKTQKKNGRRAISDLKMKNQI